MERLATRVAHRTRNEQITDMLVALEHLWKMFPNDQLPELLNRADVSLFMTDVDIETRLTHLIQATMKRARDVT